MKRHYLLATTAIAAFSLTALLWLLPTPTHAETTSNLRIKLVGSIFLGPIVEHSDIWVWDDPVTLKRYAVTGEYPSSGVPLYIVEVTNPTAPVLVATIPSTSGFDFKVRYPYLYTVDGGPGPAGAIWDITNPASPVFVANMPSSHNVTIADNGYMYLSVTGVSVFDLNTTPTIPTPLWDDGETLWYEGHDVTAIGNRMYDFNGWSGNVNIYDITDFNANPLMSPVLLDSLSDVSTTYPHNGWPTVDHNYLYVSDELAGALEPDLIVWDISDVGNTPPTVVNTYQDNDATTHNLMVRDNFLFVAFYSAGVKVFDISDPGTLKIIDEYDTSATTGDGFTGAWGIHALFGDYFYVSDMQNGIYIFELVPEPSLWKTDGVAIASDAENGKLVAPSAVEPDYTVPDGAGGAIILFDPEGGDRDMWAQRVDVNGACLWGDDGISIAAVGDDVILAEAITDDNGGAIILWTDERTPGQRGAYVQWIDGAGTPKYAVNGLRVSDPGPTRAGAIHLFDDDEFVVVWANLGLGSSALRCQRFNDGGVAQWGSPTVLATTAGEQEFPDIAGDGYGNFTVVWQDNRNASDDIYGQRINSSGVVQWPAAGQAITATADDERKPQVVYVNSDEMTAAWAVDTPAATFDDVVASEINSDGSLAWTSTIATGVGERRNVHIAFNGSGGIYAVWEDRRNGTWAIWGTHLHGSGGVVAGWTANGDPMGLSGWEELNPTLVADGDGMVVAWDQRPDVDGRVRAYGVDRLNVPLWPAVRFDICNAGVSSSPSMVMDSNGDVIIAWRNSRSEGGFAQRIEVSCGTLGGKVPPMTTSIVDTPNDAGGFVDITFNAAEESGGEVVDYEVFFAEHPKFGWFGTGVTVPATGQSTYTTTVLTAQDGTPTWYLVVANGNMTTCTWESFPASGVSMDDAPAAPQDMQVQQVGNYYNLMWYPPDPVSPDFSHYNVYRGIIGGPGASGQPTSTIWAQIAQTTDTSFRDETAPPGPSYEWSVRAEDTSGNEGPFAEPDSTVDTATGLDTPNYALKFGGNYPNPFSYKTELRFSMPQAANVTVNVYDVRGREVARMTLGELDGGEHAIPFDGGHLASGIYFYNVNIGGRTFTHKMVIQR